MERSEADEMRWNAAVSRLQAALADDSSVQATALDRGASPTSELFVVLEPGTSLAPSSIVAVKAATSALPVRVVHGPTPKQTLERTRRGIEMASRHVVLPRESKGLRIATDWIEGRVRLTGDVSAGEAIVSHADVDRDLVIVEDGPAFRRGPAR